MAKTSMIQKNKRRKAMIARDAAKRKELKEAMMNKNISISERMKYVVKLSRMRRNGAAVRDRNICELTGRARGYHGKFRLSRICLRQLANEGLLPGVWKASW